MSLLEIVNQVKSKYQIEKMLNLLEVGCLYVTRDKKICLVESVKRVYTEQAMYPLEINEEHYTLKGEYVLPPNPGYENELDIVNVILGGNYMFYNW